MIIVEENPADNGVRAVAVILTVAAVGGIAWWAAKASASGKSWVEKPVGTTPLVNGENYRVSMPPDPLGSTIVQAASGFNSVSNNVTYSAVTPSDWPTTDLDPTRWHFAFTSNATTVLVNMPPGSRLFGYE